MGWIAIKKPLDVKTYFEGLLTCESESSSDVVVGIKAVGGEYYCAVERTNKTTKEKSVVAFVVKTDKSTDKYDIYDFWYEVISEFSLPDEAKCPVSILNMLTPNEDENSLYWRKECRKYATKVMPKPDQYVVFAEPMRFNNGVSESIFIAERHGKSGISFRSHNHGFSCKISKLKSREFKVFNNLESINK